MSRKARVRAAAVAAVALVLGLFLATAAVRGTWAIFDARVENSSSTFADGWIPAPTGLSASPSGYSGSLAWTPGVSPPTPNPITGQQLEGYDAGSTNSCTQSSEAAVGASLGTGTGTLTDSTLATSSTNGHYMCYWMRETSATVWYTEAAFAPSPLQVGFVPTSVALANGGTAGKFDAGDVITITFNQNIDGSNIPTTSCKPPGFSSNIPCIDVCETSGDVFIGDTNNCSNTSDGYSIGKLATFTFAGGKVNENKSYFSITGATITINVESAAGQNVSGSATFTAAASGIQSSSGPATACTSGTYHCTPTTTGAF